MIRFQIGLTVIYIHYLICLRNLYIRRSQNSSRDRTNYWIHWTINPLSPNNNYNLHNLLQRFPSHKVPIPHRAAFSHNSQYQLKNIPRIVQTTRKYNLQVKIQVHKCLETKTLSLFQLLAYLHLLISVILLIIKNHRFITTQITIHKLYKINQTATITTFPIITLLTIKESHLKILQ